MNSTAAASDGLLGSDHISVLGYGIRVSLGILLLITTVSLASYFCTRKQTTAVSPHHEIHRQHQLSDDSHIVEVIGLDEETLLSYPQLLYSEAKLNNRDSTAATCCCSICLGDYKDSDLLRLLPDCSHLFHVNCVDPWLRMHPTCPVCRTSPLPPTPLPTPVTEVVPLAYLG